MDLTLVFYKILMFCCSLSARTTKLAQQETGLTFSNANIWRARVPHPPSPPPLSHSDGVPC